MALLLDVEPGWRDSDGGAPRARAMPPRQLGLTGGDAFDSRRRSPPFWWHIARMLRGMLPAYWPATGLGGGNCHGDAASEIRAFVTLRIRMPR